MKRLLLLLTTISMAGDRHNTVAPRENSPLKEAVTQFPRMVPHVNRIDIDEEAQRHHSHSRLKMKLVAATTVATALISAGVTFGIYFGKCERIG